MTQNTLCPVFGQCGGCQYQDLSYPEELKLKQELVGGLLSPLHCDINKLIQPIVPSPREFHYRHRLDLKLRKLKDGRVLIGYTPDTGRGIIEVEACPIAMQAVSDFIPQLKVEARAKLTPKYRMASLVVRTGDDGRVYWGGIGRKSCMLPEGDYLWTDLHGMRVHYSLDTFFQANLSILPVLFERIRTLPVWNKNPVFFDLYGGVGLFSFGLIQKYSRSYLIEDCLPSVKLAQYNVEYNQVKNIEVIAGRVEDQLPRISLKEGEPVVGMIDPPRAGLSADAAKMFASSSFYDDLLYLSCQPEALARDLSIFQDYGWTLEAIIPFDFFPKTKHVETFVWLKPKEKR